MIPMIDLTPFNTLRVHAQANNLVEVNGSSQITQLSINQHLLLLGHGANVLFVDNYPGTVAKIKLGGKKVASQSENSVVVEVAAGEDWHQLVMWSVDNNWSGMENMALIPGTAGAAAVGNIAAYGQNQEDIFVKLTAVDLETGKSAEFSKQDCQFAYRESRFKHSQTKYLVTSVTYELSKTAHFDTSYHSRYESLSAELPNTKQLTPKDVAEAVIRLRRKKLPDPDKVGTAGSFFKNPVVGKDKYMSLKSHIPQLQAYPPTKLKYEDESEWMGSVNKVKVPAGRLLDELGWKGKRVGNVGTHPTHALTVVNYGDATGREIYDFSESMREDIKKNFGIDLEYEVEIISAGK